MFLFLNCEFAIFTYSSLGILYLYGFGFSHHLDIISLIGKEICFFLIFPGHQGDVAKVEMLPNQGGFSLSHCLRDDLSLLDLFPSFYLSLPYFLYFFKHRTQSGCS